MPRSIALVCLPWAQPEYPSLAMGIVHRLLAREGLPVRSWSLHLAACEHWSRTVPDFSLAAFDRVSGAYDVSLPDYVFSVPPWRTPDAAWDATWEELVRKAGYDDDRLAFARRLRDQTAAFLEAAAEAIVADGASIVGFTSSYGQRVASLALARALKARDPSIRVVMGGPNCEGEMGEALLRCFPDIDVVVRGEAERVAAPVFRALLAGECPPALPGVCVREEGVLRVTPEAGTAVGMEEVPAPDYDEYFARLAQSPLRAALSPKVEVLFEASRGCWWGQKRHCTFCGLNGTGMAYRRKPPARVVGEILDQSARHGAVRFRAVDNILDATASADLLPRIRAAGVDLEFFYETKSNLDLDEVRALALAGIRTIQPGIESLSTSILRRMRKGVTGLQNIALLKWCAEFGIRVFWNVIYGIPGEEPEEYARMAALAPLLVHLEAPYLAHLEINRFSPYHDDPEAWGIRILGPTEAMRLLFDLGDRDRLALSYAFRHAYADGRDARDVARPFLEAAAGWAEAARRNRNALTWRRGSGFVLVNDLRSTTGQAQFHLRGDGAAVFLACDAPASPEGVSARLAAAGRDVPAATAAAILQHLVEQKLAIEEDGRYVTLPVAARPRWVMEPAVEPERDIPA